MTRCKVRVRVWLVGLLLVGLMAAVPQTFAAASGTVTHGGNLRGEPRIAATNVLGQVCPGDRLTILEQRGEGQTSWMRIRISTLATDCDPKRVASGTEGWVSGTLVQVDGVATQPGKPQPTARPAHPQPTARPARPQPTATPQPASTSGGTLCRDGTVSHSHGRGTCSHHGGIAR